MTKESYIKENNTQCSIVDEGLRACFGKTREFSSLNDRELTLLTSYVNKLTACKALHIETISFEKVAELLGRNIPYVKVQFTFGNLTTNKQNEISVKEFHRWCNANDYDTVPTVCKTCRIEFLGRDVLGVKHTQCKKCRPAKKEEVLQMVKPTRVTRVTLEDKRNRSYDKLQPKPLPKARSKQRSKTNKEPSEIVLDWGHLKDKNVEGSENV